MRRVLVAVLVLTLAPGCTSLHSVHREPANPFAAIRIGDVVNVHTHEDRARVAAHLRVYVCDWHERHHEPPVTKMGVR
jgi:hypothetical protein